MAQFLMLFFWLAFAECARAADSSSSSDSVVQLFIDNMDPNAQWAASVQNACSGSTTYVASVTSAPIGGGGQVATITAGPSFFRVTSAAIYSETSATMHEFCALHSAESSASCVVTVVDDNYGIQNPISKTISYNLTGTAYYQYAVEITAGAKKTADGGSCSVSSASARLADGGGGRGVLVASSVVIAGVVGVVGWM